MDSDSALFLDPKLLPGPKSEIRRQLLAELKGKPPHLVQAVVPAVRFLACFTDDYQRHEAELPGVFAELNGIVKVGVLQSPLMSTLLESLAEGGGGPSVERAVAVATLLGTVTQAYTDDLEILSNDLRLLGAQI
jgi:hypothetical protein